MEDNDLEGVSIGDEQDDTNFLSDVIEVIATDPDFKKSTKPSPKMFNGGGEIPAPVAQNVSSRNVQPYIRIVEQPASKALRFRYECEGRSAGSIPGASSTSENKTFPTIQVVGYSGRAIVVVSCVTKDAPHKPHPHNLVGREGCKRGVCTMEIPTDTMTVQFSNLGIQCVKKKDIEQALKVREEIRVDPFRTGFSHRSQPTTIDLNTVRLCFQVFIEGDTPGRFSKPLQPVVSEPIYDKKAMSDLSIVKLSHCYSYVDGGRHDIILLCEKVAKEDIQVRFYEETGDWEAFADFQPSQVHKQHAIWFQTPRYKNLDVTEPVKVLIQLRRPSDGATSESLPFEFLPGRTPYWPYRRNLAKKANFELFESILANDNKISAKRQVCGRSENILSDKNMNVLEKVVPLSEKPVFAIPVETNNNETNMENKEDYSEIKKIKKVDNQTDLKLEEKTFNEIINQVAELDEIYSDTQARLLNENLNEIDKPSLTSTSYNSESFDDSKTYSSLQLAFKNPLEIEMDKYEHMGDNSSSPIINVAPKLESSNINTSMASVSPLETSIKLTNSLASIGPKPSEQKSNIYPTVKRENDAEKPPLPPKRTKKLETYIGGSMASIHRTNSTKSTVTVDRTQSFCMQRPKSQLELAAPAKHLPPTPTYSTLPNPKKRSFFSKLFNRKSKTPNSSREPSVTPSNSHLLVENLAKSTGNISTHSSNSIRIPLKDSPPSSNADLNDLITRTIQAVDTDDIEMNLDLTEAEHYALYTTMAPHATQSEFDDMSCYYAPVEGGKLLTNAEVLARLASKT